MIVTDNKIMRLIRYKNAVRRMKAMGLTRVYSDNIADAVGVSALQVRKDFSQEGVQGVRRGGYCVDDVLERLTTIVGCEGIQTFVLVGVGSLGTALLKYTAFSIHGIEIVAAFDKDEERLAPDAPIPIYPVSMLSEYCRQHNIMYAIMTVPEAQAMDVCDILTASGIKGILNFAPIRVRGNDDVIVNNVNLVYEIENLVYFVRHMRNEE